MFRLTFHSEFSEFTYIYGDLDFPEWAFRVPRVYGLTWTFNGTAWVSGPAVLEEAEKAGYWKVERVS